MIGGIVNVSCLIKYVRMEFCNVLGEHNQNKFFFCICLRLFAFYLNSFCFIIILLDWNIPCCCFIHFFSFIQHLPCTCWVYISTYWVVSQEYKMEKIWPLTSRNRLLIGYCRGHRTIVEAFENAYLKQPSILYK